MKEPLLHHCEYPWGTTLAVTGGQSSSDSKKNFWLLLPFALTELWRGWGRGADNHKQQTQIK